MARTVPSSKWKQDHLVITDSISHNSIKLSLIGDLKDESPDQIRDDYCAFLVLAGNGYYEDSQGFNTPLKPGSLVQHLPGLSHKILRSTKEPWMELSFRLSASLCRSLMDNGLIRISPPVYSVEQWRSKSDQFLVLMAELKKSRPSLRQALSRLLIWFDDVEIIQKGDRDSSDELLSRIRKRLDSHLPADRSEEDLLNSLDYSYDYLRHLFKKETGITPRAYREGRRINEALELMRTSGLNVAAAADLFGYSDQFVFSRAFKRVTGQSPRQALH